MKKYIMISMALAAVGYISIFGVNKNGKPEKAVEPYADMFFIYQLSDVPTADDNYETAGNWVYSATQPNNCAGNGDATCFIKVNSSALPSTGTEPQRLVSYLVAQNAQPGEFATALAAVNALRLDTKPEN